MNAFSFTAAGASAILGLLCLLSGLNAAQQPKDAGQPRIAAAVGKVSVARTNYHGWPDSFILSNGNIETIIVPAVGRVMQFRFAGDADGPFWENRTLDGKQPDPKAAEWGNFGGDKTWPAPQADWPKISDRAWPPPPAFDSMPVTAGSDGEAVSLTSPVDRSFGVRTTRVIRLAADRPIMTIETIYHKVQGEPQKVGVWIITQLQEPVAVYVPLPMPSRYPSGYNKQSADVPPSLRVEDGWISLVRDRAGSYKIGSDAQTLIWLGPKTMVRIDSPRSPTLEYPDQGSSAEVYTNRDPLPYVELEMLGPLHNLRVGDSISQTNTYTLLRRTKVDPKAEVRKLLNRP